MSTLRSAAALVGIVVLGGCADAVTAGSDDSSTGTGPIGAPCTKSEDCPSSLCVRTGSTTGVCTSVCGDETMCPQSPNWRCLQPDGLDAKVCACRPNASAEICGDGVDNDCDGKVDDCRECGGKTVAPDDPHNCGACGVSCSGGMFCSQGSCRCPTGKLACSGACVDPQQDSSNCGACGHACGQGSSCVAGTCTCTTAGQVACPGLGSSSGCTSLQTDAKNCGACGKACGTGFSCVAGSCQCATGQTSCGGSCTSLQNDSNNCGGCGTVCTPGSSCVAGTCQCSSTSLKPCPSGCVNTTVDKNNCGGCGVVCGTGQTCSAGKCTCPSNLTCNDVCMVANDPNNCGACGKTCGAGQTCSAGKCTCTGGKTACGDTCITTYSDPSNCGGCGKVCAPGQICSASVCTCPTSTTFCAALGACVDLKKDASSCGMCGNACNAGQVCTSGTCNCPTAGQTYCAAFGGCVDVQKSTDHCGTCDKVCNPGEACTGGGCACPNVSEKFCASTNGCVDLYKDAANCGGCDKACPAQTHCGFGKCACDAGGQTLCGSTCFDLQTDKDNCGACGKTCPGALTCVAGACACPAPALTDELRLTSTTTHTLRPTAAWNGTHVGVVYLESTVSFITETHGNVYFALLNPDGTRAIADDIPLTNVVPSSNTGAVFTPHIIWTGTEFGVLFGLYHVVGTASVHDIMLQRIAADGSLIGGPVSIQAASGSMRLTHPRLAWSSSYGGYAMVGMRDSPNTLTFRRLGADATAPDPENNVISGLSCDAVATLAPPQIEVAPDGSWAVALGCGTTPNFILFNPDGSLTKPVSTLTAENGLHAISLARTNTGWAIARDGTKVAVSQGPQLATPDTLAGPQPGGSSSYNGVQILATPTDALELAWGLDEQAGRTLHFQRFLASSGGKPVAISADVPVLPTPNLYKTTDSSVRAPNYFVVDVGSGKRLAIWSDTRFGTPELYARAIDTLGCPLHDDGRRGLPRRPSCGRPWSRGPAARSRRGVTADCHGVHWFGPQGPMWLPAVGERVQYLALTDVDHNGHLSLDARYIYSAGGTDGVVVRAPRAGLFDGSLRTIPDTTTVGPNKHVWNVAVDDTHVYWANNETARIQRLAK